MHPGSDFPADATLLLQRMLASLGMVVRSGVLVQGDPDAARKAITRMVARVLVVERSSIWQLEPEGAAIRCACLYDGRQDVWSQGTRLAAVDFPAYFKEIQVGRTVDAGEAQMDPRTAEFTAAYLRPLGIASMLDVPLKRNRQVLGVFCCEHVGDPRVWSAEEIQFAHLAAALAVMVEPPHESLEVR